VLTGDRATELDGPGHHLRERLPCPLLRIRVAGIVDDDRVGVAAAGVRDDRDLHVVRRRDLSA
jgi:hypothetical protein